MVDGDDMLAPAPVVVDVVEVGVCCVRSWVGCPLTRLNFLGASCGGARSMRPDMSESSDTFGVASMVSNLECVRNEGVNEWNFCKKKGWQEEKKKNDDNRVTAHFLMWPILTPVPVGLAFCPTSECRATNKRRLGTAAKHMALFLLFVNVAMAARAWRSTSVFSLLLSLLTKHLSSQESD